MRQRKNICTLLVKFEAVSIYIYGHAYPVKLEPERYKLNFLVLRFGIFACSDFSL